MMKSSYSIACVVIGVWLLGCGEPAGPETAEVTGTVSYQGAPLIGANVLFEPVAGGSDRRACQAVTDDDGRFSMSTYTDAGEYKTGMIPGTYGVSITKLDTSGVTSTLTPPKNVLPERYASPRSSGFTATVTKDGENDFHFTLE